jgi:hypothetical protein
VLQLLHSHECGPMQVPSLGGARYVVTVLDDFPRLSVVKCYKVRQPETMLGEIAKTRHIARHVVYYTIV